MTSYLNHVRFNQNEFNQIVSGGMPVNEILSEFQATMVGGGEKHPRHESLEDLVIPLGLDAHFRSGCIFRRPTKKPVLVMDDHLFDSMFASVGQIKPNKSSARKTQKRKST
jgi:hypothetical protein